MENKKTWRDKLRNEFGCHFKDNPGELQFLEAFIEENFVPKENVEKNNDFHSEK